MIYEQTFTSAGSKASGRRENWKTLRTYVEACSSQSREDIYHSRINTSQWLQLSQGHKRGTSLNKRCAAVHEW